MPKPNEGKTDRTVRIILGIILLGLVFFRLTGIAQIVAGIVGVIALVTGVIGFCGLYKILAITTLEKKTENFSVFNEVFVVIDKLRLLLLNNEPKNTAPFPKKRHSSIFLYFKN